MSRNFFRKFLHTAGIVCLMLTSASGVADDTEIYFSTGQTTGNQSNPLRPNVLFILDTSGSMAWDAAGTSPTQSRMQVLRDSMREILTTVEDINLGLMRFTNDDGGPVIFPITYIDANASSVVGEPADVNPSYSNRVTGGTNDAEQRTDTNVMMLSDPTLDTVATAATTGGTFDFSTRIATGNDDAEETVSNGNMLLTGSILDVENGNIVGVRFDAIDIPRNATINSAFLDFWVQTQQSGTLNVQVRVQLVDNAGAISSNDHDISGRVFTTGGSAVAWNSVSNPSANSQVTSPDIKSLVQNIVNRSGWNKGQAMMFGVFYASNSGTRDWISFNTTSDTTKHPRLRINYTVPNVVSVPQTVGLRFDNVNIPQGATLTEASLTFTPQVTDSGAASWTIAAEDIANSPTFTSTASNISSRTKTTTTTTAWTVPTFTADVPVTTPTSINLMPVVQSIVDRGDWCGGNAMSFIITGSGTRRIKSVEQAAAQAPEFRYTYQASSSTGCYKKQDSAQISTNNDDAEETTAVNDAPDLDSNDLDFDGRYLGVRFRSVQIPQNATIIDAKLRFTSKSNMSSTMTYRVKGEATANSAGFTTSADNISTRSRTTAQADWAVPNFSTNGTYETPSLAAIVSEIVADGDWAPGNAMSFILERISGSGSREAYTRESDANKSALLIVTYQSTGGSEIKTVRQRLVEIVDDLQANGSTPIVETMEEATRYWRGQPIKWGKNRDGDRYSRISHAGSYCTGPGACNGANTGSYPQFGIYNPSGCNPATDPNNSNCSGQEIKGTTVNYISPFSSELTCQQNYQVLLTDGAANSLGSSSITDIQNAYFGGSSCASRNLLPGSQCGSSGQPSCYYGGSETCGVDLAKYLFENDHSSTLDNTQNVVTYTIAFNLTDLDSTQFLKDMAKRGTGGSDEGFFSASNAEDLVSVFSTILADVKDDPTSFVAPSLATNAFNRLLSRDEVYFGLFTPSLDKRWFGNVKKYGICIDSQGDDPSDSSDDCTLGEIQDANDDPAVDPVTNKFKPTATSVWSGLIDGQATTKGGSGGEITDYTQRIIYTEATNSGNAPAAGTSMAFASSPGYQIDVNTWDDTGGSSTAHIRNLVCPTPSTTAGSECESRMLYLLGKIKDPDDDNDASATTRWSVNDVLHSSPAVITYGGESSQGDGVIDVFYDKLVYGTNDGGLRFVDGATGKEEWTFMPQAVLQDLQQTMYANPEGTHPYGLDMTPVFRARDVNGNGSIEPADGDFVHVYIGMRRGGNFIYALDVTPATEMDSVTDTVTPKFLWRIQGGTGDFTRMSLTFSQPRLAKIYINNTPQDVLIFGGGYDVRADNGFGTTPSGGTDNVGNAIYIVNPGTGARIMSISGSGSGADIEVPDMHYSIPSRITVLDSDGDFIDDRLYFGDIGGQVWRVDLATDVQASGGDREGSSVVGRLANISSTGSGGINQRRFFEPPSVVQVLDTEYAGDNGTYDYVLMGTGWRAHPLNKTVHDRFYAFRDRATTGMTDSDDNNLADSYPDGTSPTGTPILNTDMIDVTSQVLDSGSTTHQDSLGWYFDFDSLGNDGEKVLSAPVTIAGSVFFTTYQPDLTTNVDLCSAQIGGGSAYNFNILSAGATIDWDLDGTVEPLADRSLALGGGIPSDVVPVFTKEGIVGIVGIEGGAAQLGTLSGLPRFRTYWYEESGT